MRWFCVLIALLVSLPAMAVSQEDILDLIPPEYIIEAQDFQAACTRDAFMAMHYDCECMGAKFFDMRVEKGPEATKTGIALAVGGMCPNSAGRAGYAYGECISRGILAPAEQTPEEFCTCYANAYANMYTTIRRPPSARLSIAIQTKAVEQCTHLQK